MFECHPVSLFSRMKNCMMVLMITSVIVAAFSQTASAQTANSKNIKEWTFLLFINGHNNLDTYGAFNINQMEEVGSNSNLNMVVQWASLQNGDTRRLLVEKDDDPRVTSPILESMPAVDMGDYQNLIEFVRWGVKNFPARKYMIAVWNHGNGWHLMNAGFQVRDISNDDLTGNRITTEQLGMAMEEAAKIIGHKVDIYGSDACLMAMAEIAGEMKDSVSYFVGSQDLEPGYGWPYSTWMKRWEANPKATGADVSKYLTEEYLKAYSGGIYGRQKVTFSAYDMSRMDGLYSAVRNLKDELKKMNSSDLEKTRDVVDSTLSFTYDDYKDLVGFTNRMASAKIKVNSKTLNAVKSAVDQMVIANGGTGPFANVSGVGLWLPNHSSYLDHHGERYSQLKFNRGTGWMEFLEKLNR